MIDTGEGPDRGGEDDLVYCAACGDRLPDDVWCPVRTVGDGEDLERVVAFCDGDCEDDWAGRR